MHHRTHPVVFFCDFMYFWWKSYGSLLRKEHTAAVLRNTELSLILVFRHCLICCLICATGKSAVGPASNAASTLPVGDGSLSGTKRRSAENPEYLFQRSINEEVSAVSRCEFVGWYWSHFFVTGQTFRLELSSDYFFSRPYQRLCLCCCVASVCRL